MNEIAVISDIFLRKMTSIRAVGDLWLIHGFPESSLCFKEAFSILSDRYNVYAPDLPGFGVSPTLPHQDVEQVVDRLAQLIQTISSGRKIGILGHSWGGIAAVKLAARLESVVQGYIDVEGSIIDWNFFFKPMALDPKTDPKGFAQFYVDKQRTFFDKSEVYGRYDASIRFADADNFLPWARSCLKAIDEGALGLEFQALQCPKTYFCGARSAKYFPKEFLNQHQISYQTFEGCGHWPMVESPDAFYKAALEFFDMAFSAK